MDLLSLLATLSQSFQRDTVDFAIVQDRLHQVRSAIVMEILSRKGEGARVGFSPNLSQAEWDELWDEVLANGVQSVSNEPSSTAISEFLSSDDVVFRGVQLQDADRGKLCAWLSKFAVAVMSRLAERFPEGDMELLGALEIFNPARAPTDASKLAEYGDHEINLLCEHYCSPKLVGSRVPPPMADARQLKVEWRMFKVKLSKMKSEMESDKTLTATHLIAALLGTGGARENIEKLSQLRAVIC